MTIFKLQKFPKVCRACLKDCPSEQLILLSSAPPGCHGLSVAECLAEVTPDIPSDYSNLIPSKICLTCLAELEKFSGYRKQQTFLTEFVMAMVQLRHGNPSVMVELFSSHTEYIHKLFRELDLCSKDDFLVEDLLCEYPSIKKELSCENEENETPSDKNDPINPMVSEDVGIIRKGGRPKGSPNKPKDAVREPAKPRGRPKGSTDRVKRIIRKTICQPEPEGEANEQEAEAGKVEGDDETSKPVPKKIRPNRRKSMTCHEEGCTGKTFETRVELVLHQKTMHPQHVCDICGSAFITKSGLEDHLLRHTGKRTVTCTYCDMVTFTREDMRQHMKVHIKKTEASCSICRLTFRDKPRLRKHMDCHVSERNHVCSTCGQAFKSKPHLTRHFKTVHLETRYTCDYCGHSYGRKDKLKLHVEKAHNIQSYFPCEVCVVTFDSQEVLDSHRSRHDNPKHLECGVCLCAFLKQEALDDHLCITYQDDYICCEWDWKFHRNYNKHQMLVHGIKTNVRVKPRTDKLFGQLRSERKQIPRCSKCAKEFSNHTVKQAHLAVCDGKSPFSMKVVPVSSSDTSNNILTGQSMLADRTALIVRSSSTVTTAADSTSNVVTASSQSTEPLFSTTVSQTHGGYMN